MARLVLLALAGGLLSACVYGEVGDGHKNDLIFISDEEPNEPSPDPDPPQPPDAPCVPQCADGAFPPAGEPCPCDQPPGT
ncbi:MAG: hypothetical protein AAGC56_12555 [Pseudomonadota bacterium]